MGEGGILKASNPAIIEYAKWYANQGKLRGSGCYTSKYGQNFRPTEMAVGLGLVHWMSREAIFSARRAVAVEYSNAGIPYCFGDVDIEKTTFYKYPVYVENKGEVLQSLAFAGVVFPGIVHSSIVDNPYVDDGVFMLPWSRWISDHQICLPMGRNVRNSIVYTTIRVLKEVAKWAVL